MEEDHVRVGLGGEDWGKTVIQMQSEQMKGIKTKELLAI